MGPSQFIPSTWALYESRLSRALGVGTPNPWNAKDAIMATAMYMADIGAAGGSYSAERNAACKYYSGKSCTSSTAFYGDQVMDNAGFFQNQIDIIAGS
jgi:membrane-bound lytic murein transglycosylase B